MLRELAIGIKVPLAIQIAHRYHSQKTLAARNMPDNSRGDPNGDASP
jgi:hypothetical protein